MGSCIIARNNKEQIGFKSALLWSNSNIEISFTAQDATFSSSIDYQFYLLCCRTWTGSNEYFNTILIRNTNNSVMWVNNRIWKRVVYVNNNIIRFENCYTRETYNGGDDAEANGTIIPHLLYGICRYE